MSSTTRKDLFTVLGEIHLVEGKKKFSVFSPDFYQHSLGRLKIGDKIAATFSKTIPTRSEAQLNYHWILMTLMGDHCGYKREEMHDAVMRLKFGTKEVKIGSHTISVRQSISEKARMSKSDVVELIDYDLTLCGELGIVVPTKESLGYLPR